VVFNFDVRAIWRSGLSTRSPWRQNWKPRLRPVWRRTPLCYITILATLCAL